jgi:hypothetical protein
MRGIVRYGLFVLTALVVSGCAFGNRHAYHTVLATPTASGSAQLGVATHDQRPYVLSGNKQPQFVGLSRGGYGNPFDIRTADDAPLADGITQALTNSVRARGFRPVAVIVAASMSPAQVQERLAQAGGDRALLLNAWDSPAHAREAVPRAFKGKLEELLNDPAVTAVLMSAGSAR